MFEWLQEAGNVASLEMYRTFNCGIGMIIAVPREATDTVIAQLIADGENAFVVGHIESSEQEKPFVEMLNVQG